MNIVPYSDDTVEYRMEASWLIGGGHSPATSGLGQDGLVGEERNSDASRCLGKRCTHVEQRAELRHVHEGVQVAPCTRTLLQQDRVAVAVVRDDMLKRLVHAQEFGESVLTCTLEGRRVW